MTETDRETYAIIPCTNQKAAEPGPAREVWSGAHFQLVLAHAEMFYDKVFVLSYKYGLIPPEMEIEPYDINLRYSSAADKLKWWSSVRKQIAVLVEQKPLLVALYTGNFERDRIIREFVRCGHREVIIPWANLAHGQRMQKVYDCDPPFDLEALNRGEYTLPENYAEPKKRGRPKKTDVQVVDTDAEIEWED